MALKLAGFLLYWDYNPIVDASVKTPALANFEFLPDVVALDEGGAVTLWVECGSVTMNKLTKLIRRLPHARVVVMKETPREALRLRSEITQELDKPERIEIIAWPDDQFKDWVAYLGEKIEVFGEAGGLSINAVVNDHMVVTEFNKF